MLKNIREFILNYNYMTCSPMFPNLKKVIGLLLVLPFWNARFERIVKPDKINKSYNRNRLNTETISALMATKAKNKIRYKI